MSEEAPPNKQEEEEEEELEGAGPNPSAFLASFADLMSLLVVFFVLLYSLSRIREDSFLAVVKSLAGKLNPERVVVLETPSAEVRVPVVLPQPAIDLVYLNEIIRDHLRASGAEDTFMLTPFEDRLVISLTDTGIFEPATATLTELGQRQISLLSIFLARIDNRIDIRAHASPGLHNDGPYPDPWQLTLTRAKQVAQHMELTGAGRPMIPFGLADSRADDLSRFLPEERRASLAERIDIVIRDAGGTGQIGVR